MMLSGLLLGITLWYGLNIVMLYWGFPHENSPEVKSSAKATSFTIVVVHRNEPDHLKELLESISQLNYPKESFEVIVVDDHSDTALSLPSFDFSLRVVENKLKSQAPKKDALELAVSLASGDWIITTDADCIVPQSWLLSYNQAIHSRPDWRFIFGVVVPELEDNSVINTFQVLDFYSLQATAIGAYGLGKAFMCNGANMAYQKQLFYELKGYEGNNNLSSGDDVFLLEKALCYDAGCVGCVKGAEARIKTKPLHSWRTLYHQHLRWASKTSAYSGVYPKQLALAVLGMNGLLVLGVGLGFFYPEFLWIFPVKFVLDYLLLARMYPIAGKLGYRAFLSSFIIYPFFAAWVGLGVLLKRKFSWKGRTY